MAVRSRACILVLKGEWATTIRRERALKMAVLGGNSRLRIVEAAVNDDGSLQGCV